MNGAHDPGPVPEVTTRCNHCDKTFPPPVPVIGQPLDAAYFQMVTVMCAHLQQRHQKVFHQALSRQMPMQVRFSHLYYLDQFQSNDPELHKYADLTRHMLHRKMQRRASDQKLTERVNSLPAFDGVEGVTDLVRRADVLELLKQMRDALQEEGLYPEVAAAEQNLVVVPSSGIN